MRSPSGRCSISRLSLKPAQLGRGLQRAEDRRLGRVEPWLLPPARRRLCVAANASFGGSDRLALRRAQGLGRRLVLGRARQLWRPVERRGRQGRHGARHHGHAVEEAADPAGRADIDRGVAEELGQPLAGLVAGAADQPEQQEERHHRGDEIGVGDLPGPAMVAVAAADDCTRRMMIGRGSRLIATGRQRIGRQGVQHLVHGMEAGLQGGRHVAAGELDRDRRRVALQVGRRGSHG